jgi:hypothetical protein
MAFEIPGFNDGTRLAGADLSTHQFKFVKLNSSGAVILCAATTDKPYGILQDKPVSGQPANVMLMGISKVVSAAGNTKGNRVGTDGSALAAEYVNGTDTTKYIVGEIIDDADAANGLATIAFNCLGAGRGA